MLKLLVAIYVCYHIPAQLNIHSEHVLLGAKHRNSKGELKTSGQFLVLWCRRKQLVVPLKSSLPRRKNKTKQKNQEQIAQPVAGLVQAICARFLQRKNLETCAAGKHGTEWWTENCWRSRTYTGLKTKTAPREFCSACNPSVQPASLCAVFFC